MGSRGAKGTSPGRGGGHRLGHSSSAGHLSNLIKRLQEDPQNADLWTAFYQSFHGPVYYLLHGLCGADQSLAEDLCQESFLRFIKYRALSKVSDEASAVAFLRVTARNLFYSYLESSKRAESVSIEDLSEEERLQVAIRGQPLAERDASLDLERLRTRLPPREREMLKMVLAGSSLSEIAAAEGIRYGTAAIRLHRLKHRLRLMAQTVKSGKKWPIPTVYSSGGR